MQPQDMVLRHCHVYSSNKVKSGSLDQRVMSVHSDSLVILKCSRILKSYRFIVTF